MNATNYKVQLKSLFLVVKSSIPEGVSSSLLTLFFELLENAGYEIIRNVLETSKFEFKVLQSNNQSISVVAASFEGISEASTSIFWRAFGYTDANIACKLFSCLFGIAQNE